MLVCVSFFSAHFLPREEISETGAAFGEQGDVGAGVFRAHTEQPRLAQTAGLVSPAGGPIMAQGPKSCWPRGSSVP